MNNKNDMSHRGQKDRTNQHATGKNQHSAGGARSDKDTKSASAKDTSSSKSHSSRH